MKAIRKLWLRLRSSLWFLPAIMAAMAAGLAILLIEIDGRIESNLSTRWPRIFGAGAEGARGILEAIAGSMITVTGVVFSVVVVALSLASNQYSPRILRNFMGDRGTQLVLGVFVSIFVYCLIVMRTIVGGDEQTFVPGLSVVTAILLALIGIAFLIYFIHHIADSIQVGSVIAAITRETLASIKAGYPSERAPEPTFEPSASLQCRVVNCSENGYLQTIAPRLKEFAAENHVILRIEIPIGDFAADCTPLLTVFAEKELSANQVSELREFFVFEEYRTIEQDPAYGVRQIVDIALKALSPSLNDTTTAINCIDHLGAILGFLIGRHNPSRVECINGEPVVLRPIVTIEDMIGKAFLEIRQSAQGNAPVLLHMVRTIEGLLIRCDAETPRRALLFHLELLYEMADRTVNSPYDREELVKIVRRVLAKHPLPSRPIVV
jgi:uncharacterized membrane protein